MRQKDSWAEGRGCRAVLGARGWEQGQGPHLLVGRGPEPQPTQQSPEAPVLHGILVLLRERH